MNLDRRQMLCVIAASLLAGCGGGTSRPDWRPLARKWMRALIPDDDHGPGADSPGVWSVLEARLREDAGLETRLAGGFGDPALAVIPEGDKELLERLNSDAFVGKFHRLVVECYYGSAVGWRDLGLETPPQPKGFQIRQE